MRRLATVGMLAALAYVAMAGAFETVAEAAAITPEFAQNLYGRVAPLHEADGCRLTRFDTSRVPSGGAGNRVLLLLIQLTDGSVWPYYAEEKTLRTPGVWDPVVAKEILDCLDAVRPSNRAVIGYRDFTNAGRYCNGK